MPTLVAEFTNTDRFNTPDDSVRAERIPSERPGWHTATPTAGGVGSIPGAVPMSGIYIPERAPSRVGTLPDPAVGGYSEWQNPVGRTVDQGFSVHSRAAFEGQGHYDQVPTWNNSDVIGRGTPNRHGTYLRQGLLSQLSGYNPPDQIGAIGYVAALASTGNAAGYDGSGVRL